MKRIRHTSEQIIHKLREAAIRIQRGQSVPQVCRQIGVTAQTYYRWRKEYGGMRVDQAKRLKDLEKEAARGPPQPPHSPRPREKSALSRTSVVGISYSNSCRMTGTGVLQRRKFKRAIEVREPPNMTSLWGIWGLGARRRTTRGGLA